MCPVCKTDSVQRSPGFERGKGVVGRGLIVVDQALADDDLSALERHRHNRHYAEEGLVKVHDAVAAALRGDRGGHGLARVATVVQAAVFGEQRPQVKVRGQLGFAVIHVKITRLQHGKEGFVRLLDHGHLHAVERVIEEKEFSDEFFAELKESAAAFFESRRGVPAEAAESIAAGVDRAIALAEEDGMVCSVGSLYMSGAVREHILGKGA